MYIEAIDKNGKETSFDYRQYSGILRSIARSVQMISDRSNFTIDWENPDRRLYLHEHPYLVPQLLESGSLMDADMQPIKAGAGTAQLQLIITAKTEKALSAQLILSVNEQAYTRFTFINEEQVWVPEVALILKHHLLGRCFIPYNSLMWLRCRRLICPSIFLCFFCTWKIQICNTKTMK